MKFENDVVVVGGCGHVGLPLAIVLASRSLKVASYDLNEKVVAMVNGGQMPFNEPGADEMLKKVLEKGKFSATSEKSVVATAEHVVVVIGTPIDEHMNPDPEVVPNAVAQLLTVSKDGQHLVLRSTVYPGVTRLVEEVVKKSNKKIDVSFCPERIAEGKAIDELSSLPQIVSARNEVALDRAKKLFANLTSNIVEVSPEEAELAKLFTNTWRYIKFAAANQLYTIANDFGVDFERVRQAIVHDYPRANDMPGAGFAAGPCLFKDTMQLAAFNNNNFTLGHSSMLINEGLPLYLVSRLEAKYDLSKLTVGILGMAFKAESDDTRSSLAYKLKRILKFKAGSVVCADSLVSEDHSLISETDLIDRADLIIIGAPHKRYASLKITKTVVDIWNVRGQGVLI
ncbi:MAG: nucleotide sugar dehydrogenase [Acidimicrobiaceae bacterium]